MKMESDMIDAYLRGATGAGVLEGWYAYGSEAERHWVINPPVGWTETFDRVRAARYVEYLWSEGVKPLWRS